jgi:hypothetical protein
MTEVDSACNCLLEAVLAGLVANAVCHLILSRCLRSWVKASEVLLLLAAGAAGCSVATWVAWAGLLSLALPRLDVLGYAVLCLAIYLCLSYVYFHYVHVNVAGLRVRILREIAEARDGLTVEELRLLYNTRAVVKNRLDRLTQGGHLVIGVDGLYHVGKPHFLWLYWGFELLKLALLGHGNRVIEAQTANMGRSPQLSVSRRLLMALAGLVTSLLRRR